MKPVDRPLPCPGYSERLCFPQKQLRGRKEGSARDGHILRDGRCRAAAQTEKRRQGWNGSDETSGRDAARGYGTSPGNQSDKDRRRAVCLRRQPEALRKTKDWGTTPRRMRAVLCPGMPPAARKGSAAASVRFRLEKTPDQHSASLKNSSGRKIVTVVPQNGPNRPLRSCSRTTL